MGRQTQRKDESRRRIVEAAATQFRENGISGAGVSDIMKAAGMTHGGFYAHFPSKDDLTAEAIEYGLRSKRKHWFRGLDDIDDKTWLERVTARYLRGDHRDNLGDGCAFAALGPEVARQPDNVREMMERELRKMSLHISPRLDGPRKSADVCAQGAGDRALALFALCVGGLILSRAVKSKRLSDRILRSCREFAAKGIRFEEQ